MDNLSAPQSDSSVSQLYSYYVVALEKKMICYYSDFVMPTVMFSSLTATSVTINWSHPEGSLEAEDYTIFLQRLVGNNRQLCPTITDSRQITITTTSTSFTNLQEFSIYTVTVTARVFDVLRTSTYEITTLSAGSYRTFACVQ